MDPCVTCGTEETTPVCTCDCQCLETARRSGCREIKLIAPTRDTDTAWTENDPIVPEGVLCLVKDRLFDGSLEYFIGDGESKYSELTMLYAGAPLSRTGAANHSPLAASGKSTLDPSWLPDATSNAKGAVMTSSTGASGKVPIAANEASALDPSWLPVATSAALGGVMTSTTGAQGKVPIAGNSGTLDPSWLPDATSSTKGAVMASTTKAANNVVKADGNGDLDGWKDAIISAIIADDGSGGLSAGQDGNLEVDFDAMYEHNQSKFEALLKSLKMLIPLETDLNFYVDTNNPAAGDTIIDGRGTQSKPFKTIQACVDYVTGKYALGTHTVRINVGTGTYTENVTLPNYSATTGYIAIMPTTRTRDVIIKAVLDTYGTRGTCIYASGGRWYLTNIEAERVENPTTATSSPSPGCFRASGAGTELYLRDCSAIQKLPSDPTILATSNNYSVAIFGADSGALIDITNYNDTPTNIHAENSSTFPSYTYVMQGTRQGIFQLHRTNYPTAVTVEGSCTGFLNLRNHSQILKFGSGSELVFTGTMTGKRYVFQTGGYSDLGAAADYFPGDEAGTVDSNTFCYY